MDLEFIKKKLDTLQGKNKQSARFWKPSDGEQRIRIVPYKYNKDNPFIELKFYYYRNGAITKTLLSPSVNSNPDPVLEFCEKLRSTGTKENWVLSKSYEPKLRTYVPVIVRGQEEQGVKFWGFGRQVYEVILEKMSNPDIGDITDLTNGNDLIIKFTKTPPSGKKFPETKVDVRIKKTLAVDPVNQALLSKITDEQVDIMSLFTEPTYDELKKEFENHINPDTEDAVPEDETPETPETSETPEVESVNQTVPVVPGTQSTTTLTPEQLKDKFKKMFANETSVS